MNKILNCTLKREKKGKFCLKVSVIIPAYNAENTISSVIEDLLRQNFLNMEIIVVDDGSTDNTAAIVRSFNEKNIRFIKKENGGVSSARNRGIQEANGEYLMFADADDGCPPEMVQLAVEALEKQKVDYLIAGYTKVYKDKTVKSLPGSVVFFGDEIRNNLSSILSNNLNCVYAKVYKLDILRKHHIKFDEKLPLGEDFNFNLEYLLCANSVAYLNKSVYKYLAFNSVATTMYRENMHLHRMLSLEKMNNTFARNGLVNPFEGTLRIKIFYAEIFNLQKKMCPYSYCKKMKILKNMKAEYLRESDKNLSGIYKVLRLMVKMLPVWALYTFGLCVQTIMNILPERIRGLSV